MSSRPRRVATRSPGLALLFALLTAALAALPALAPHRAAAEERSTADLSTRWHVRYSGADDRDEFGVSLASGDWNGDGIDDLAVGAWLADSYNNDRRNAGEVYLFFGDRIEHRPNVPALDDVQVVYGAQKGERSGTSVASGDWDGDGLADLAIGARFAALPGDTLSRQGGRVTILYGADPADSAREILDLALEADVILYGEDEGDRLGQTLLLADLDGDGYDDLLASAVDGDTHKNRRRDAGEVYCLWGRSWKNEPRDVDLIDFPDWRIDGVDPNDGLGRCMAAADVDGDGRLDLVVSANFADAGENARTNAGETYILLGGAREELSEKTDLARHADCVLFGARPYENSGTGLAAADLDGDGQAEIAIGADLADDEETDRARCGAVYLLRGRDRSEWKRRHDLGRETDLLIRGAFENEQIGKSLLALNWGGSLLPDLVIAANLATAGSPARERAGKVCILSGRTDLFSGPISSLILDVSADRVIEGGGPKDQAGYALARMIGRPGERDRLVIGAPFADGPRDERPDAGEVYVVASDAAPDAKQPAP